MVVCPSILTLVDLRLFRRLESIHTQTCECVCGVHLHIRSAVLQFKSHIPSYFIVLWPYNVYPATNLNNFICAVTVPLSCCFIAVQSPRLCRSAAIAITLHSFNIVFLQPVCVLFVRRTVLRTCNIVRN